MATADQIKSLIASHWSEDPDRFFTTALQIAAYEAQQGHSALAHEIRGIVDSARRERTVMSLLDFPPEFQELIHTEVPAASFAGLVLPAPTMARLKRVVHEYRQRARLKQHGLWHRRKILLTGPPGTGKTLTARVLAHELRLPLHIVLVDKLVTRFMGETGARLRQVFDLIERSEGVYLFDEFDAIGGGRTRDNDVGEMRRVLNALLQFMEHNGSDSLMVAATNTPELLDKALFRRFDDVIVYELPDASDRQRLIGNSLGTFVRRRFGWKVAVQASDGLSAAEIVLATHDALKEAILSDQQFVSASRLAQFLGERKRTHVR